MLVAKFYVKFHNGIDLHYKRKSHAIIFLNELKLMKVNENDLINDGFQHLRYNYTLKDSSFITLEAFLQHQYNTIKLIERRFLAGGGMRFRLINSNRVTAYTGTMAMYEYEQRSNEQRELIEMARLSSYLSISWDILDNLSFKHIGYYQPSFLNIKNYRLASETGLSLKMTKLLFFKMALKLTMESHPSAGINNLFYTWENSLQFKF